MRDMRYRQERLEFSVRVFEGFNIEWCMCGEFRGGMLRRLSFGTNSLLKRSRVERCLGMVLFDIVYSNSLLESSIEYVVL